VRSGFAPIEVRLARAPEVAQVWPNSVFEGLGAGAGLTAVGAGVTLLNPLAGAAVVGGVILTPALAIMGVMNASTRKAIITALQEVDFPRRLQDAIQSRLAASATGRTDHTMKLEVLVQGYGFFDGGGPEGLDYCFSFDGELTVTAADGVLYQERVFMEPYKRSLDVPPPRCTRFDKFGEDDGRLGRETLEEASEVMAAVIVRRLGVNR